MYIQRGVIYLRTSKEGILLDLLWNASFPENGSKVRKLKSVARSFRIEAHDVGYFEYFLKSVTLTLNKGKERGGTVGEKKK